jgi:hypothetical protein
LGVEYLSSIFSQRKKSSLNFLVIPSFQAGLCAENPRAHAELAAERPAEMSGIAEAPGKSDLGDGFAAQAWIGQIVPALVESARANAIA